jgi:hypothetical protein
MMAFFYVGLISARKRADGGSIPPFATTEVIIYNDGFFISDSFT